MKSRPLAALSALCLASIGGATTAGAAGDPVTLTFQSLAFQESTIAATESIVAAWNDANPDIQVELVQGSWDNVDDQLTTQFAGGTAPDVIHNASTSLPQFAEQGYLADLTPYLSDDLMSSIPEGVWETVTARDGSIVAAPTLMQTYVVFANVAAFESAGVEIPTGDTLTWDDFEALAAELAPDGGYSVGWGLRSPAGAVMSMGLNFGGDFFSVDGENVTFEAGDAELELPRRIHDLTYEAGVLDPVTLTLSGGDTLPGFYGGDYALWVAPIFWRQNLVTDAPEDFEWTVLPPLAGDNGAAQAGSAQTLSVSTDSEHVEEAAAFINFVMEAENLAALAEGDWLLPTSAPARDALLESTGGENGWEQTLATGDHLVSAPFLFVENYPQWNDQYLTPLLQQYFADTISLEDLQRQLTDGWSQVAGG